MHLSPRYHACVILRDLKSKYFHLLKVKWKKPKIAVAGRDVKQPDNPAEHQLFCILPAYRRQDFLFFTLFAFSDV
jgi:hypothetical protein